MGGLGAAELNRVLLHLERHHGIGLRGAGGSVPAWIQARIERVLARPELHGTLVAEGASGAIDALLQNPAWLSKLADELRVGETRFYRDPAQWVALSGWLSACARRQAPSRLRLLSAGCSTGEEAWTLAMLVAELSIDGRVLGLDRSREAVDFARVGRYEMQAADGLPAALKSKYLQEDGGQLVVQPGLPISFVQRDLMQGPPPGSWELILCKNVLIYFGEDAGARVARQLVAALSPGGILVVARSEVARLRGLGLTAIDLGGGIPAFCAG